MTHLMGRNGLLGRRGVKRDALRIGQASPGVPLVTQRPESHWAPRRSFRPTAGRVPLPARRVAARLWWVGTTANGSPLAAPSERARQRGQTGHYQRPLVLHPSMFIAPWRPLGEVPERGRCRAVCCPGTTGQGGAGKVARWAEFIDCIVGKFDDGIRFRKLASSKKKMQDSAIGTN